MNFSALIFTPSIVILASLEIPPPRRALVKRLRGSGPNEIG